MLKKKSIICQELVTVTLEFETVVNRREIPRKRISRSGCRRASIYSLSTFMSRAGYVTVNSEREGSGGNVLLEEVGRRASLDATGRRQPLDADTEKRVRATPGQ